MKICCVQGCRLARKRDCVVRFYGFPKDQKVAKIWKDVCGARGGQQFVCEKHFALNQFRGPKKRRLIPRSVPTLHLPPSSRPAPTLPKPCFSFESTVVPVKFDVQPDEPALTHNSEVIADPHGSGKETVEIVQTPQISYFLEQLGNDGTETSRLPPENVAKAPKKRKRGAKRSRPECSTRSVMKTNFNFNLNRKTGALCPRTLNDKSGLEMLMMNIADTENIRVLQSNIGSAEDQAEYLLSSNANMVKPRRGSSNEVNHRSGEMMAMAVAFYLSSPRLYPGMARDLGLPSKYSVLLHLRKAPFEPGLNDSIRTTLQQKGERMRQRDKLCILCFDQVSLSVQSEEEDNVQDSALVFMVQGAQTGWKMPLSYFFTIGPLAGHCLKRLILENINFLKDAGFTVVATVCDMAATNRSAINALVSESGPPSEPHQPFFIHNGEKIFTVFDPPHLLKLTRNLLLKHRIEFEPGKSALWGHIQKFYEHDQKHIKIASKLTEDHVHPVGKNKTKTILAAQVLSHRVYAGMMGYVMAEHLPIEASATAVFVEAMDQLFDSFIGDTKLPKDGKTFRTFMHDGSGHALLWEKMVDFIDGWKLFSLADDSPVKRARSQDAWIVSLKAFLGLKQHLKFEFLPTNHFSQRALEAHLTSFTQLDSTNPDVFTAAMKRTLMTVLGKNPEDLAVFLNTFD